MKPNSKNERRPKAYVSTLAINHIHLRNPWVSVWWSAAFPGLGHIILGSYMKGFLLIIWEILINVKARANLSILYSFTGDFEQAKNVLDKRWLILYVAVYVYAMWNSYRSTVSLNKLSVLAERNKANITPFKIDSIEINYLEKRDPWVAVVWSILMPGLGHLHIHKLLTGFFVIVCWVVITYFSHILQAVHLTFAGAFAQATAVINPEWLLFMPSLYCFAFYDAYVNTVEYNKLFEKEQADFLKQAYQDPDFEMPV